MTSWLFTPADNPRLLARAHERGADVVLLDLEDAVAPERKAHARAALPDAVARLVAAGARVAVRVNSGLFDLAADLMAVRQTAAEVLVLPKVTSPEILRLVDEALGPSPCRLVALIESAAGLLNAQAIAHAPRLAALAFGTEDFSADLGISPTPETLTAPAQALVLAARAAGVDALGFPGSIADVADLARFEASAALGQRLGFDGVLCIHPGQVEVVNRLYCPTPEALNEATRLVAAYEAAGGGAVLHEGRMIDPPVVARALRLLRRSPGHKVPA